MAVKKFEKSLNCAQNRYTRVFDVADRDFDIRVLTFKMADSIWRFKSQKSLGFSRN